MSRNQINLISVSFIEYYFSLKYSPIALAAVLPAPIALITVAAPVTTSPAKTPH